MVVQSWTVDGAGLPNWRCTAVGPKSVTHRLPERSLAMLARSTAAGRMHTGDTSVR